MRLLSLVCFVLVLSLFVVTFAVAADVSPPDPAPSGGVIGNSGGDTEVTGEPVRHPIDPLPIDESSWCQSSPLVQCSDMRSNARQAEIKLLGDFAAIIISKGSEQSFT